MIEFGVATAYGTMKRALMHRPGEELQKVTDDTLEEFHFQRPVKKEKFLAEAPVRHPRDQSRIIGCDQHKRIADEMASYS